MKQFDLTHLPKVSRAELAFQKQNALLQLDLHATGGIVTQALSTVEPNIFDGVALRFKAGRLEKRERTLLALENTDLHLFGTLPAHNSSVLLSIPKITAKELVYNLLGSTAPVSEGRDDLSAIEEGIFTFILTAVLSALQPHLDTLGLGARLAPLAQVDDATNLLGSTPTFIVLTFEMMFQETSSDIHLALENTPALMSLFESPQIETPDNVNSGLSRAGNAQVPVSISIGEASIFAKDLDALQIDNIIVLDKTAATFSDHRLSGIVDCQIGEPLVATLKAELIVSESNQYALRTLNLA